MIKKLNKNKKARTLVTFLCVLISALSQAYVIQVFIQPANLLSSGFTGVAILIEKITSTYFGFSFSTSLGMIVLNVPVAILCYKNISHVSRSTPAWNNAQTDIGSGLSAHPGK